MENPFVEQIGAHEQQFLDRSRTMAYVIGEHVRADFGRSGTPETSANSEAKIVDGDLDL